MSGTPWIQNRSKSDVAAGNHRDPGVNSLLIQISDPAAMPPMPKQSFGKIAQFEFLDLEDCDTSMEDEWKITDEQAAELVALLTQAIESGTNVIVHCHAGICRSGAVVDVAVEMGFEDPRIFRAPNMRVKNKMRRHLGWTYD